MNKMKVKVTMDAGKLSALSSAQIKAVKMTAEQMRTEIIEEGVIPFDEGTLQNVQTYVDTTEARKGNVSIAHDSPYASKLYWHPEYDFQKTFNANARGMWWEDWISGPMASRPKKLFIKFFKSLTGG